MDRTGSDSAELDRRSDRFTVNLSEQTSYISITEHNAEHGDADGASGVPSDEVGEKHDDRGVEVEHIPQESRWLVLHPRVPAVRPRKRIQQIRWPLNLCRRWLRG